MQSLPLKVKNSRTTERSASSPNSNTSGSIRPFPYGFPLLTRGIAKEAFAAVGVATLALVTLSVLGTNGRAWLLFYDGDSVLPALVAASMKIGQAQHWVLSSPLFIPETIVYLPVALLGMPVRLTFLIDAIINWFIYYLCFRFIARQLRLAHSSRVLAALVAVALLSVDAMCESSADRNALEPASLLATTTYYSGTIWLVLLSIGLLLAAIRLGARYRTALLVLGVVTAIAVMSNPLVIAWWIVPSFVVLLLLAVRLGSWARIALVAGVLLVGVIAGMTLRVPFQAILVQDNLAKLQFSFWQESLSYYGSLLGARLQTPGGVLEVGLALVAFAVATVSLVRALAKRDTSGIVVHGVATTAPLLIIVGSIVCGTFAARYEEPVVFYPLISVGLVVGRRAPAMLARIADSVPRMLLGVAAALAIVPPLVAAGDIDLRVAAAQDPSVACAARFAATSGLVGAGQYWTVRSVKAYVPDPRVLVQTDDHLAAYSWLSNDADLVASRASYTIESADSGPFMVPDIAQVTQVVNCGRYTIKVFAHDALPIGALHH